MRYSSDRQTEQSIEGQQTVCEEFCKRQGYEIVGKYIDRALSAFKDTDKRVEFNRMIDDSKKKLWQGVVVYKLDRFSRTRHDSAFYKHKLKKYGVKVISATENITDSPEGVILESVLEGMAEFYSKELSQKVKRGRQESARKCNTIGGQLPLGYKIENKKYVVDDNTAHIVRTAFEMFDEGAHMVDICKHFNKLGYRTSKGAKFNKSSFHNMFRNERYIGTYIYMDQKVEDAIPPIIDKQLYQRVKQRLSNNQKRRATQKAKANYLLSGKVFCGHCGGYINGESGRGANGVMYYYYGCANRKRFQSCDKKNIKKEVLENIVLKDAVSFFTPEVIDKIAEIAVEESIREASENTVIPSIKKRIADTEKAIHNLMAVLEQGLVSPSVEERVRQLEREKMDLWEELIEAEKDYYILEKEHVVFWLERFCNGDLEDEKYRKQVADLLVNSVTISDADDGYIDVTTVYNLDPNHRRTFKVSPEEIVLPPINLEAKMCNLSFSKTSIIVKKTHFIRV